MSIKKTPKEPYKVALNFEIFKCVFVHHCFCRFYSFSCIYNCVLVLGESARLTPMSACCLQNQYLQTF